jgi:hypothetical protein
LASSCKGQTEKKTQKEREEWEEPDVDGIAIIFQARMKPCLTRITSATLCGCILFSLHIVSNVRLLPDVNSGNDINDPYEIGTSQKLSSHANDPPDSQQRAAWRSKQPRSSERQVMGISVGIPPHELKLQPQSLPDFGSAGWTLASWIKPTQQQHDATARCIASLGQHWALALNRDGCVTFLARVAQPMEYTTLLVAPADAWTHIAVSYAGKIGTGKALQASDVSIYINGTLTPFFAQPSKVKMFVCRGQNDQ